MSMTQGYGLAVPDSHLLHKACLAPPSTRYLPFYKVHGPLSCSIIWNA